MSLTYDEFQAARDAGRTIEVYVAGRWQVTQSPVPLGGYTYRVQVAEVVSKARPHADLIKLWADNKDLKWQYRHKLAPDDPWVDCTPQWYEACEYRVKPERVFPKSSLSFETVYDILFPNAVPSALSRHDIGPRLQAIADAAVKQYILDSEKRT